MAFCTKPISELWSIICRMGLHIVTCHPRRVNALCLNPRHTSRYLIYLPGQLEGWVDFGVGYIPGWFTCPQTVTHLSTNHLIATRPGDEILSLRLLDRYATTRYLVISVRRYDHNVLGHMSGL